MSVPVNSVTANRTTPDRMPLAVFGAFAVSVAALFLTAGLLPLPLVFVGAAAMSYFSETRLVGNNPYRWFIRLGLMLVVFLANPDQARESDWAIGTPRIRNLFAQYYAAEVALQFWRFHPRTTPDPDSGIGESFGDTARPRLLALILSGMIFLSASNTFDERWIRLVLPLFLVLMMIGLYQWRPRVASGAAVVWRGTALFLALSLGFGSYVSVYSQRGALNEISSRLIRVRPRYEGSGMAQSPRLGETFDLRGSPTRVLRIEKFAGDSHWRGIAFTEYRKGRWGPSFVERRYRDVNDQILSPSAALQRRDISEITVTRLTNGNPLIYAPLSLATLSVGDEEANTGVALETGGPFRTRAVAPFIYLVSTAGAENYQGLLATPITPDLRAQGLRLPDDFDPRVAEFTRRIVRDANATTARAKADAVAAHLISTHSYSLRYRPTTPDDPVVGFVLSEPPASAHCEYFAASAALMLRTVGVPTRYVTGYLAHETESDGVVVVRQRDAHAWCEAYLDGTGWVTVDATPGNGRPDVTPEKVETWRRVYEWLQDRWTQAAGFLSDLTSGSMNAIVGFILALLILWGLILYFRARRALATVSDWAYTGAPPDLAALAVRFEAALDKADASPPAARPYGEHLSVLQGHPTSRERLGPLIGAAEPWIRLYDRARWGHDTDEARAELLRLLETVETEAARAPAPVRVGEDGEGTASSPPR